MMILNKIGRSEGIKKAPNEIGAFEKLSVKQINFPFETNKPF